MPNHDITTIITTITTMKEFVLAPLLNPDQFNEWLASAAGAQYADLIKKFSDDFTSLLNVLDKEDEEKLAQAPDVVSTEREQDKEKSEPVSSSPIAKSQTEEKLAQAPDIVSTEREQDKEKFGPVSDSLIAKSQTEEKLAPASEVALPAKSTDNAKPIPVPKPPPPKTRQEKWLDCLLGEEVGIDLRVHGLAHDEVMLLNHFIGKKANAPILEFLIKNLPTLSAAARSCEDYIYTNIDFDIPLTAAVKEIRKAKEIIIEYPLQREAIKAEEREKCKAKNLAVPEVLKVPDAVIHRTATLKLLQLQNTIKSSDVEIIPPNKESAASSLLPPQNETNRSDTETLPLLKKSATLSLSQPDNESEISASDSSSSPSTKKKYIRALSPIVQKQLQDKLPAKDKKLEAFPIFCTHRMTKILGRQPFEKILPHIDRIFSIYQFLATRKYVEHSKTLQIFYLYMIKYLSSRKESYYLSTVCDMLSESLQKLITDNKLNSGNEIKTFIAKNPRILSYWEYIYLELPDRYMPVHLEKLHELQKKIDSFLYPPLAKTSDLPLLNRSGSTGKLTPSPPLEDDNFYTQDSDNDVDLLRKLEKYCAKLRFVKVANRAKSDNAIIRTRHVLFRENANRLTRVDTVPIGRSSTSQAHHLNAPIPEEGIIPLVTNNQTGTSKRQIPSVPTSLPSEKEILNAEKRQRRGP